MNGLVLGVDGGGSKTIAILVNRNGQIEHISNSAGINPQDKPDWKIVFSNLIESFIGHLNSVEFGCIGAPGYGEISSVSALQDAFFKHLFRCPVLVENDVRVAFDGAFLNGAGILLLVGTGSMAWASNGIQHARFGGWGDIFGDEGSGFWIGREALSIVSRQLDGRLEATAFGTALLKYLSIDGDQVNEKLFTWTYEHDHRRSAIADISRFVNMQAIAGDPTAQQLLHEACQRMAEHVIAAKNIFGDAIPWSIAGGVSKSLYVCQCLSAQFGVQEVKQLPPVGGGAWRAAQAAGWKTDQMWIHQLRKSLAEHGVDS